MSQLITLSTNDVEPMDKIEYWDATLSSTFTGKKVEVVDSGRFRGRFDLYRGSECCYADVVQSASDVIHGERQARTSEPNVILHLQVYGESINFQDDQVARLKGGHYTICDSELPFHLRNEGEMGLFVFKMKKARFLEVCPDIAQVRCRPFDGTSGTGKIFTSFIHSLWRELVLGMSGPQVEEMSSVAIELLGASLRQAERGCEAASSFHGKDHDLREYIERNLGNRDLSPAAIAHAFDISPRYLHKRFSATPFTVGGYIRHRRLENARRMLANADYRERSIAELALICGFADSSQLASSFRQEYQMTPREYRTRAVV